MPRLRLFLIPMLICISGSNLHAQQKADWIRVFGDTTGSKFCYTMDLAVCSDGGYALGGLWRSEGDSSHVLQRLSPEGEILWESEGEPWPRYAESILALPNDQTLAVCSIVSAPGVWLTSYDSTGHLMWSIADSFSTSVIRPIIAPDDEILFVHNWKNSDADNRTDSSAIRALWLTPNGDTLRLRDYFPCQGNNIFDYYARQVFHKNDHLEIVWWGHQEQILNILKLTPDGDSISTIGLQIPESFSQRLISLFDDGYLCMRNAELGDGTRLCYLTFLNENGDSTHTNQYYLPAYSYVRGLIVEEDLSITLYGGWGSDGWPGSAFLMHIWEAGDSLWTSQFNTPFMSELKAVKVADGGYLLSGSSWTYFRTYLLKTSPDTISAVHEVTPPSAFTFLSPFPNPFNSSTTISYDVAHPGFVRLGVYDAGGRLVGTVREGYAGAGRYQAVWEGRGVGSGTYFLNLEAGGTTLSKPIVLVR